MDKSRRARSVSSSGSKVEYCAVVVAPLTRTVKGGIKFKRDGEGLDVVVDFCF